MDDIAERLRRLTKADYYGVMCEAADEIDRLQAVIAAIDKMDRHLVDLAYRQVEGDSRG